MIPLTGKATVVTSTPRRRVTVDPRSEVSPSYWYVDGLAVPHTEIGRRYLKSAWDEDVAAGYCMDYESLKEEKE